MNFDSINISIKANFECKDPSTTNNKFPSRQRSKIFITIVMKNKHFFKYELSLTRIV